LKQGDTLPYLAGELLHPDLTIVDLTDSTVTLRLVHMETHGIITLPAAILDDPTLGLVMHEWRRGETDVSGAYFYHWVVRWSDQHIETFPNDRRGRVLSIEAPLRDYAGVPRADHFLCGDLYAGGWMCANLDVDLKSDPGRLTGNLHGQGSVWAPFGLQRDRRGLVGQGRLTLNPLPDGSGDYELDVEY
jgi:hypothetical protein